jgi:ferric enterobactin receptor
LKENFFPKKNITLRDTGITSACVVDSLSAKPIEFAVVAVFLNDSAKPLTQTLTSDSGKFRLSNLPAGHYKMIVSLPGYRSYVNAEIEILCSRIKSAMQFLYLFRLR